MVVYPPLKQKARSSGSVEHSLVGKNVGVWSLWADGGTERPVDGGVKRWTLGEQRIPGNVSGVAKYVKDKIQNCVFEGGGGGGGIVHQLGHIEFYVGEWERLSKNCTENYAKNMGDGDVGFGKITFCH